jgi:hypothetical protein
MMKSYEAFFRILTRKETQYSLGTVITNNGDAELEAHAPYVPHCPLSSSLKESAKIFQISLQKSLLNIFPRGGVVG